MLPSFDWPVLTVMGILLAGAIYSFVRKKLTLPAALTGVVVGGTIYLGAGFTGLAMLTIFFILGSAATRGPGMTRNTGQVLANAGMAALLASLAVLFPTYKDLLETMLAASLASATADTLSSELGTRYGRRFYDILSGKPGKPGMDGVISLEGTLIGVGGALVIALVFAFGYGNHSIATIFVIITAGTIGNLTDSLLGATLERQGILSNDAVNFFNTLTAALVAGALSA